MMTSDATVADGGVLVATGYYDCVRSSPMNRLLKTTLVLCLLTVLAAAAAFYVRPLEVADGVSHYNLWRAGIRSQYVQLGPYRIHYLEQAPNGLVAPMGTGTHSDQPIVLVHGLGGRAEDWTPMIEGLARNGFHVYALDLLGFGRSPKPDVSYSITLEQKVLGQFIDSQQLTRPDLAGWSLGGWIAMSYALDHPDRVRRLLLYDSAGIDFTSAMPLNMFVPQTPAQLAELRSYLSPHPQPIPAFAVRDVLRRARKYGWVVQRGLASAAGGRNLLDGKLGGLHMPVLIVWGGEDRLIPPAIGEKMHQEIPQSVFEIAKGCGHLAALECAPAILPRTLQFLNAQPPMSGGEIIF